MITLKTLPQASAQEVFDQIKNHLLSQNKKCGEKGSYLFQDDCYYRLFDNESQKVLKCAAGCLISDEEYKEKFEKNSWEELIDEFGFPKKHKLLIIALQVIHDNYKVEEWEEALKTAAVRFSLKYQ